METIERIPDNLRPQPGETPEALAQRILDTMMVHTVEPDGTQHWSMPVDVYKIADMFHIQISMDTGDDLDGCDILPDPDELLVLIRPCPMPTWYAAAGIGAILFDADLEAAQRFADELVMPAQLVSTVRESDNDMMVIYASGMGVTLGTMMNRYETLTGGRNRYDSQATTEFTVRDVPEPQHPRTGVLQRLFLRIRGRKEKK